MEDILRTISNVVGVNGCFVCDEAGDILAVSLRSLARDHSLSVVGYTAAQAVAGLRASSSSTVIWLFLAMLYFVSFALTT